MPGKRQELGHGKGRKEVVVTEAKKVKGTVVTEDGLRTYTTKFTEETVEKVLQLLKDGKSQKDAGLLAGLGRETLDTWLYNGRHEPDRYPHLAKFAEQVEEAKAERRGQLADRIVTTAMSGAPGTWQAAAWYLERTDPENWGRKDKVTHEGDVGPRTQINQVVILDDQARAASRDLLKRVAGHAGADVAIGPGSSVQLEDGDDSGG